MRNIANEKTDRRAATTDLDHTSLLCLKSPSYSTVTLFVQYLRVVAAFPTFPCGLFTDGTNLLGRVLSLSPLHTPTVMLVLLAPTAVFTALSAPVVRPHDFTSASSWDAAYAAPGGSAAADWLLPYEKDGGPLKDALLKALSPVNRASAILELGCGTSVLASQLISDGGFLDVTSTDFSATAVRAAIDAPHNIYAATSSPGAQLKFKVADARATGFADGSFAAVFDKGTLDAICTGEGFDFEAGRVSAEVARILEPGGRWVCVSLMPGRVVQPILQRPEWESIESMTLDVDKGADGASGGTVVHLHTAVRRREEMNEEAEDEDPKLRLLGGSAANRAAAVSRHSPARMMCSAAGDDDTEGSSRTVVLPTDYRLAQTIGAAAAAAGLVPFGLGLAAALPLGALAAFLSSRTRVVRFSFDDEALEILAEASDGTLGTSGDNFASGRRNRWRYADIVEWSLYPNADSPILVGFREVATSADGQGHLFPVLTDARLLSAMLDERVGAEKRVNSLPRL